MRFILNRLQHDTRITSWQSVGFDDSDGGGIINCSLASVVVIALSGFLLLLFLEEWQMDSLPHLMDSAP